MSDHQPPKGMSIEDDPLALWLAEGNPDLREAFASLSPNSKDNSVDHLPLVWLIDVMRSGGDVPVISHGRAYKVNLANACEEIERAYDEGEKEAVEINRRSIATALEELKLSADPDDVDFIPVQKKSTYFIASMCVDGKMHSPKSGLPCFPKGYLGKKLASEKKQRMPGVTFSSVIKPERKSEYMARHTGLYCLDLDTIKDIGAARKVIEADPNVAFCGLSVSGTGLWVCVRGPAAKNHLEHTSIYSALAQAKIKAWNINCKVDAQTSDVSRLRYMSYDPDLYANWDAVPYVPDPEILKAAIEAATAASLGNLPGKARKPGAPSESVDYIAARREIVNRLCDENNMSVEWESDTKAYVSCPGTHANATDKSHTWIAIDQVPTLKCHHESCEEEVAEFNFKLRSAVGKAESTGKRTPVMDFVNEFQTKVPPIVTNGGFWYAQKGSLWQSVEREEYGPLALESIPYAQQSSKVATLLLNTFEMQQSVPRGILKPAIVWEDEKHQSVLVNCANGLFRVTDEEISPVSGLKLYFTGQTAGAYDPKATCPNFRKALFEAQPTEDGRLLCLWWLGYMLYPGLEFRLSLVNFGATTTGKTTVWYYGAAHALGTNLCKNLSLSQICDPTGYSLPNLRFALLNVGGELDEDELAHSSRFKLLCGGEAFEARGIYGSPFTMQDYVCKMIFNTNHLPRFKNGTDAELERLKFLEWDQRPVVKDESLQERVKAEKDGILSEFMLPGLQDILRGNPCPSDSKELRKEFALNNDPMKAFVEELCLLGVDPVDHKSYTISKDRLRSRFQNWCHDNDLPDGLADQSVFARKLKACLGGKVVAGKIGGRGQRYPAYVGITLKPDSERGKDV